MFLHDEHSHVKIDGKRKKEKKCLENNIKTLVADAQLLHHYDFYISSLSIQVKNPQENVKQNKLYRKWLWGPRTLTKY